MKLLLTITVAILAGCGGGGFGLDTTAPTTLVAPAVSGTTDTATILSVKLNENATGYYLVLPYASTVPTSSEVQAGTAFTLSANLSSTTTVSGLTANTSYKIYFVAKDRSNNVQTTVQSVVVTTGLTPVYLSQGGLTWMPIIFNDSWVNANAYCTNTTINGLTGWRMPSQLELSALYASGAMAGQGWTLDYTWASTANGYSSTEHYYVDLARGSSSWGWDAFYAHYVSCVR